MNNRKTALILVDFENEWINPSSEYYVGDISDVIEKTNQLIKLARKNNWKIIFTKHIEKDSKEEFAPDSENIEIIKKINKSPNDAIVEKNKISPFYQTSLEKELEGVGKIITCGILANLCVRSLVQDAYDRDFDITVVKDCCVSFDEEAREFTFKDLKETREEVEFVDFIELQKTYDLSS